MNPHPQTIKSAQRRRLFGQTQLLYKLDNGQRVYDEASGEQVFDLDQAPAVLADIGVPPKLQGATFASAQFRFAGVVRQWYADILSGIDVGHLALVIGDGANYIAAAALRNAVKRAKTVAWYDWHDFTKRYTDGIDRSKMLSSGLAEDTAMAVQEVDEARDEDFNLRYVYEVLAITGFDITDVLDFAVPDITSLFRTRTDYALTTIITVPTAGSPALEADASRFGNRGALLRLFESEAVVFDGRQ
jgi:hypothetical protein